MSNQHTQDLELLRPLTVTLPPTMSAATRFYAHLLGITPEKFVVQELTSPLTCMLQNGVFGSDEAYIKLLNPKKQGGQAATDV